ncbi:CPBP family intramembrane glutamic endopeptidase [Corynebacterium halotolerans]|uniref:CAAX amino terminal protease family protein n=1 Tax=Corynebacterium halotolerans YIM 70093 = DSM 44683 TaxID=1121362 RepID=M1NMW8_9CORY|nr:CPBP family intramembrane glutamic endopeptidase [Corynebacterium halotolerans]AGF72718.1 CAAX amino terminal protease family protein [Corynebacterium halotolerans YIM 70093 = DSM 44683]
MLMLLLWSLPTLVDLAVARGGDPVRRRNGLLPTDWWWVGWGVVVGLLGLMLGLFTALNLPTGLTIGPGTTGAVTGFSAAVGVAAAAAGEEIFFRGFVQGHLARRFGARAALWGQAVIFLLPHLFLLLVDARLWILLPVQFLLGLVAGVLRRGSGSVLPGVIAHVLTNVAAGALLT